MNRIDLDRDLPTTDADRRALRRAGPTPMSYPESFAVLRSVPAPSDDDLRARHRMRGEPFRLD